MWRYILLNQKGAILASSDGHKWVVAIEAVERAESQGMSELAIECLQTITLLDWLKEGSGLGPSKDALALCLSAPGKKLEDALKALIDASLITYKRYNGSYGLFEGSDFDIEAAISEVKLELGDGVLRNIAKHVSLPTIIAKRHYHKTGTLRWANFTITPLDKLQETIAEYKNTETGIALGVIYFRTNNESDAELEQLLEISRQDVGNDFELLFAEVVISQELQALFEDIEVLDHILREQKELAGDRIARREMRERITHTAEIAKDRFLEKLDGLSFIDAQLQSHEYDWQNIGRLVDSVASQRFKKTPYINSELLNRERPSAQANLALKKLLYALLRNQGTETLGLTGYPAERGLLEALLLSSDIYRIGNDGSWSICEPLKETPGLKTLWQDTLESLKKNKNTVTNLQSIYDLWTVPFYGLTKGVCPFTLLYLL